MPYPISSIFQTPNAVPIIEKKNYLLLQALKLQTNHGSQCNKTDAASYPNQEDVSDADQYKTYSQTFR